MRESGCGRVGMWEEQRWRDSRWKEIRGESREGQKLEMDMERLVMEGVGMREDVGMFERLQRWSTQLL